MNSLLADLQREREERARAAQQQAASSCGNLSQEGGALPAIPNQEAATSSGSRKRKQAAPQRKILVEPAQAPQVPGASRGGDESTAPSGAAESEKKEDKDRTKKSTKKRKASGPTQASEGAFVSESGPFDAASIAQAWTLGEFFGSRESYGEMAYDQITRAARVHSVTSGKAVVKFEEDGSLVAEFKATSGKRFKETCEGYCESEVQEIVAAFLQRNQTSKSGRRTSQAHLVTVENLAEKAPPILWSLYSAHGKDTHDALKMLVQRLST